MQNQNAVGSKEWHEERRKGIGGSDCAAALGLSKWATPYQLYLQKIGEAEPLDETWDMGRGKALEPLLRQHYANTTGQSVQVFKDAIVSPDYSFMRYNPDGIVKGRLVEFKTAAYGRGWGEAGSDEIPQEYTLQVQHGMIVTGLSVCDVTVSIGGNAPKYFIVEADRELQEMIIESEARFWEFVTTRTPPPPTTLDDVAKIYNQVNGQSIIATPEIDGCLHDLQIVRDNIKQLEENKEQFEVVIKNFMGENEVLTGAFGNTLATWKKQSGALRIDAKRLKAEQPIIAAQYTNTGEPTRRFLLK